MVGTIIHGDALSIANGDELDDNSVDAIITSPPYWKMRKYPDARMEWPDGWYGELGQEPFPQNYVSHLTEIFSSYQDALKDSGSMWVNIDDKYSGSGNGAWKDPSEDVKESFVPEENYWNNDVSIPRKSRCLVPERFVIEMVDDYDFILRNDKVWHKSNPVPHPVRDRLNTSWEHFYFFTVDQDYYFDLDSIKVEAKTGGKKNPGDVVKTPTSSSTDGHNATFSEELVKPIIESCVPEGGTVLDPFSGSGTVGKVADELDRNYIGVEIGEEYAQTSEAEVAAA
ncbi:site-specific DNA-methyltransferase [Natrinema sp. DC36]|uniref:DNA-methyltransferase n=1 Tax=Natrinema sp. DC36 TaxID=2878680 RepID=UPI001CF00219|nr:site-specific DNA-methyltransferase [Natrinema sp. DC36]